jgi:DNA segregation ATPase FtsK/SpoIIIE, S-DNA-T family
VSKLLSITATLDLLRSLKSALGDFARREAQLKQESSNKLTKLRREFESAMEVQNARVSAELSEAENFLESQKQKIESSHQARATRITSAINSGIRQRKKEVEEEEGRSKYQVQRDTLQTSRAREAELKKVEARYEKFVKELSKEAERLERLETRVQRAFRGYKKYKRWLSAPPQPADIDLSRNEDELLSELQFLLGQTSNQLERFLKSPFPLFFRLFPLWLIITLLLAGHILLNPLLAYLNLGAVALQDLAISLAASLTGILILYFAGRRLSRSSAANLANALDRARKLYDACDHYSAGRRQQETHRLETEAQTRIAALDRQWNEAVVKAAISQESWTKKLNEQAGRLARKNDKLCRQKLAHLQQQHEIRAARIKSEFETRSAAIEAAQAEQQAKLNASFEAQWQTLSTEWRAEMQPLHQTITSAQAAADELFPDWTADYCNRWQPPQQFAHAAKFGRLQVDLPALAGALPQHPGLAFPGPLSFSIPALLTIPREGSILFETKLSGQDQAIRALNQIILRILATTPPGKLNFTIIDPVELGQNFAGIMHLADYEGQLINDRIWTQPEHIEERLAQLNEQIEKVTQMYLRNEYETITEYNQQAGRIAEKYHFLVVADFPAAFTDLAARRLLSIASSGARCGVYTLIHWDQQKALPPDLAAEQLRNNSISVRQNSGGFVLGEAPLEGTSLILDSPPGPELATVFLHKVGRSSIDSNRVEMPFADITPPQPELWSLDTTAELRAPIGRTGATKLQYLSLGKGTRQHALIAGKTGSGKSTLFHVLITNLSLWCSPDQVEFYLVDFKKGVEFKAYAVNRLPHARVVAIESDREFGLSVLQRVDDELKRRGDLFRKLGAQDVAGYKRAGGTESLPRTLLIIDEFQEFFVEDDRISQNAALLLDRIVRQGRAFGIHVLLGSQTLGGAYTLARATLGQMVVRIALQCNEADAYLIMDDDNAAPRLLSRPGEAIYNDKAGALEGNSPFQVVWLPDHEREAALQKIRRLANQAPVQYPDPIVFEGNAPADIRENVPLRRLLEAESIQPTSAPRVWLGAPNSIKGPTEAVFKRQSGNHLLLVGQREEAILAMMGLSLVSLAAQHPLGSARFILFDSSPPGSPERDFLEKIAAAIPHEILLAPNAGMEELMSGLGKELENRSDPRQTAGAPSIYLLIHGLQRFKKLRYEEEFEFSLDESRPAPPGNQLNKIINEGSGLGLHLICACDTANNLTRALSRKAISEFEMRVLFQMSASDSATLIDNPKAGYLGLHRAIFHNGHEGYLETFRPYALPAPEWVQQTSRSLARLLG